MASCSHSPLLTPLCPAFSFTSKSCQAENFERHYICWRLEVNVRHSTISKLLMIFQMVKRKGMRPKQTMMDHQQLYCLFLPPMEQSLPWSWRRGARPPPCRPGAGRPPRTGCPGQGTLPRAPCRASRPPRPGPPPSPWRP